MMTMERSYNTNMNKFYKNNKKRAAFCLLITLSVCLVLSSCGGGSADYSSGSSSSSSASAGSAPPSDSLFDMEVLSEYDIQTDGGTGVGEVPKSLINPAGRKLIFSAELNISSEDYTGDYIALQRELERVMGYTESEKTEGVAPTRPGQKGRVSYFTFRIPSEKFNNFVSGVENIGELKSKSIFTDDISDRYYDTQNRIEMLEIRHERLMGYLRNETKMDNILKLEKELSELLYELDTLKGNLKGMDFKVEYARVDVILSETVEPEKSEVITPTFFHELADSFKTGFEAAGSVLKTIALVLSAVLPVLAICGVFVVIIVIIVRLVKKSIKKKSLGDLPRGFQYLTVNPQGDTGDAGTETGGGSNTPDDPGANPLITQ